MRTLTILNEISIMRHSMPLLATMVITCCLAGGCRKGNEDNPASKALLVQLAGETERLVSPIKSVFYSAGDNYPFTTCNYSFFREAYNVYPRPTEDSPFIIISASWPSEERAGDIKLRINTITVRGLDENLGLGSAVSIPMEQGKNKGLNESIKDVQLISVGSPDFNIVITTVTGDVLTIRYNGEVLGSGVR